MTTFGKQYGWSAPLFAAAFLITCQSGAPSEGTEGSAASTEMNTPDGGQSTVKDDLSQKNVVGIAVGSADHTTLVAAVKAAELVDVLSNAGPFTVFAPTNAAFDALPAGTVDGLLKPEKKGDLQDILQYHVFVGVLKAEQLHDGQTINMVNGSNAKITVKDGKVMINDANIVASVPASNGIVHVIDKVILPPAPAN
ncbi:MAG: fasciclin domain-containing protein [Flavobacteriales bacterium]